MVLSVQNFMNSKMAKVSFSYQLEHLVNLDMIVPEESRKTSVNDKLVSFSGRFRERETDEGKARYKYLALLNDQQKLAEEREEVEADLTRLQVKIRDAADWYVHIAGIPVPDQGYRVLDETFDTPARDNHIILQQLSDRDLESLPEVQAALTAAGSDPEALAQVGQAVDGLLRNFRSPILGIGDEAIKQDLRDLQQQLIALHAQKDGPASARQELYGTVLGRLEQISQSLDREENHTRLGLLRSVRNYKKVLKDYDLLLADVDENRVKFDKAREAVSQVVWYFNDQELSTRSLEKQDAEIFGHWFAKAKEEWERFVLNRGGVFKAPDQRLNTVLEKEFKSEEPAPNYMNYLFTFMPVILVVLLLYFVFSRQMKGVGNNAMNFGKSPAKLLTKDKNKVTFQDVAGLDEATEELEEIVEFLRNPQKFTALGGRIPKGVLCVGPPGTGKTLIAKAVAGEADRPFFSISGSDFVEMFVGVGASRIRDMFEQAKKNAPCIIFMDEIDAVGRHRGAGIGGGHDEREQTLNQLLVEMDGFDSNEGVILMAATNRPDVLDKALLRPGRFDRRIVIDLPDLKGRYEILKVHARRIKLDESVELMEIARATPGSSGADLMNLLNEAALLAARKGRTAVTREETIEARDKVLFGKERRSLEVDEHEKLATAYHESGHAVVGLCVEHSDPVDKVTIVPRGFSLGATHFLPKKNRVSYWKKELVDRLAVMMGGRAAEEVFLADMCSGARQDIEQATSMARSMVCEWGMSEKLGTVAYDERSESGQYLGMNQAGSKKYSERTAEDIDAEVKRIIDEAHARATALIKKHKVAVELMTQMLMEFETLDADDVRKILDGSWNVEEKREKLKKAAEAHMQTTQAATPPPPPPINPPAQSEWREQPSS
jgi:cell division protease FtsH